MRLLNTIIGATALYYGIYAWFKGETALQEIFSICCLILFMQAQIACQTKKTKAKKDK